MATNELQIMLTAKGNLENELRTARDRVKDLSKEIRSATSAGGTVGDELTDEFRKAQKAAADLGNEINKTNRKIKDSADQSTTAFGKLGGSIVKHQNAIRNAGVVAAGAFGLMLKSSVTAASNLQESMSKIDAVFGSSAADIKTWSETSATAMVMSQQKALEAAGSYGNLFQAFGLGREQSAEMSKNLVQLAADLASFNNTSVEDALLAIQSGISGETEPMKKYGAALSDVRLKEEALAMGLYNGTGMLTVAAKAQASYSLMLKDTSLAQGDVERTADGLANTQKRATAEFDNAKAKIGTDLLPVVTALTQAFGTFAGFIGGLPGPIRNVALVIGALSIAAMIATPRIIAMMAAMKTAGITAGGMAGKFKGAGAMLMGPWGAALLVGSAAIMYFADQTAKADARVNEFKDSIDATTGALNAGGINRIAEQLLTDINKEDWGKLEKLGYGVSDVTAAITGGESAWKEFNTRVNLTRQELEFFDGDRGLLSTVQNNAYGLRDEVQRGKDAFEASGKAASVAGVDINSLGNDFASTGEEAADTAGEVSALTRALGKLQAVVSRQKALKNFKKSLKDFITKPSKDAAYSIVEDFDSAFSSFEEGSAAQAKFVLNNYGSVQKAIKNSGLNKKQKNQLLSPLNEAKNEADLLLASLREIDKMKVIADVALARDFTNGGTTPPIRRANGGPVWGAGTATSDSIPAMLSNGEYVLRAAAVRTLGLANLNKLNHSDRMTDPALLDRMALGNVPTTVQTSPLIGSIVVHNPSSNVDVEKAVVRGMARAERIKKERG